jgi:hypothetical protein
MNAAWTHRRTWARALSSAPSVALWFRLAALYLLVTVVLGAAMGASGSFALRSVHSHLGLLGWVSLALAGLIYRAYPEAGASRLAAVHFWLFNLALPPMLGSLAALMLGHHPGAVPILAGSQVVALAGLLAFVVNVFVNLKQPAEPLPGVERGSAKAAVATVAH